MTSIYLRRAYDEPGKTDGQRILIDRLWPRGVSKDELELDGWMKDLAPSDDLRKWFDHDPDRWDEFQARYARELDDRKEAVGAMRECLAKGRDADLRGQGPRTQQRRGAEGLSAGRPLNAAPVSCAQCPVRTSSCTGSSRAWMRSSSAWTTPTVSTACRNKDEPNDRLPASRRSWLLV